jgi:hypothetical protein
MAPVHSKPLSYEATRRTLAAVHEKIWPAVLKVYGKKPPSTTKGSGDSTGDKEDTVRFSCPLNPNASKADLKDKSNTFDRYVNRLGTGCTAEEYIKYRKDVEEVASLLMKSGEGEDEKCKKCVNIATATLQEELKEAFSLEHVRCQELNERMEVSIREKHKVDALQHEADELSLIRKSGDETEEQKSAREQAERKAKEARRRANAELRERIPYPPTRLLDAAFNKVAHKVFKDPENAYRNEVNYLKHHAIMDEGADPTRWIDRLKWVSAALPYFPRDVSKRKQPYNALYEEQLVDIIARAVPVTVTLELARNHHMRLQDCESVKDATIKLVRVHDSLALQARIGEAARGLGKSKRNRDSDTEEDGPRRKRTRRGKGRGKDDGPKKGPKPCPHCGKNHANHDSCWTLPKNKDKAPANWKKKKGKAESSNAIAQTVADLVTKTPALAAAGFTPEQLQSFAMGVTNAMISQLPSLQAAKTEERPKKRKLRFEEANVVNANTLSEDDYSNEDIDIKDDSSTSSEENQFMYNINKYRTACPFFDRTEHIDKKQRRKKYTAEIVVEMEDRDGNIVPARALLDTGTTSTIVLRKFVRKGRAKSYAKPTATTWNTLGGNFQTKRKVLIDMKFPELNPHKKVSWICHMDETTDPDTALYDIIIGMDMLCELGLTVDTETKTVRWEGNETPLCNRGALQDVKTLNAVYNLAQDASVIQQAEARHNRILDADYSKVDIDDYIAELSYLSPGEQSSLRTLLNKHPTLFKGGLGVLDIKPVKLELVEGAVPYHSRAFPVPQKYELTTKKEMDRLTGIGVFKKTHESEWAAPTFIQPKKTGDVRILTDFRRLNAVIKRRPFPLPKISDLLQKLSGFKYATAIDLSMGYYHIPLDEASKKLCTTILPWGKYQYQRLPMGIKNSPDIFQAIVADLFGDLEWVRAYIDDILITSNGTYEDHLQKLDIVLSRLEKAGFRANVRKCFFAKGELEYLGYWLTRDGIQPQPKKVEAILRLQSPKTKRQLRHFLGMVNFYRDMWKRRSHLLAPLTALVSGKSSALNWKEEHQQAFEAVKSAIAENVMLAFPDFTKEFHIYTDASDYQLGAVITQEGKPLAFYSRKLNAAQKRYTTGEQELLSIVETLKEFRNILLGQKLIVHTDHKNILYGNLANDRIVRWRLLLEEFGPEYRHIAGKDNVVADALSRLDKEEEVSDVETCAQMCACYMAGYIRDENWDSEDEEYDYCYVIKNQGKKPYEFPMSPAALHAAQQADRKLMEAVKSSESTKNYLKQTLEGVELYTLEGKVVVPRSLQADIVAWYHKYLGHPGSTRMVATINQTLWWPSLRKDVEQLVRTCRSCQLNKKTKNRKYGHLPAKEAEDSEPWKRVNVDMIGPFIVRDVNNVKHELRALTMIDPATGWFEIKDVTRATSAEVSAAFDDTWLARYPRPQYLGYDGGSEFKSVFDKMRQNYGMKKKPSTSYNPQSNGIIERVHQVLTDILRTFELEKKELDERDPWGPFLATVGFAIRSSYHTTLGATPGQLVYGRDMILPMPYEADWELIKSRRQAEINRSNAKENKTRVPHEYKPGDKVMYTIPRRQSKLRSPRTGPHEVVQVNSNGTLLIKRGAVTETVNMRLITPFFEPTNDH